ncbi:MAG: flagellar type III secretion system pore protein FliP [Nitrospiraceae bacterium]|nr:flagellar type III secretion system pore protein FliP [Nitrospiraceae bacterium]
MGDNLIIELLKLSFIFIALIGALYFVLRILKSRIMPSKGMLQIVHYQPLGTKKGVAVVKVLKDYLLLGMTDDHISLLAKLNAAEIEQYLRDHDIVRMQAGQFRFDGLFSKIKGLFSKNMMLFPLACLIIPLIAPSLASAAPQPAPTGTLFGLSTPLEIMVFLTLLSFLPAILMMTTCFTRIVVVLSFLRQALGTAQVPPTQVIVGLSLFITIFVMSPVIDRVYSEAYVPYSSKQINLEQAMNNASVPMKEFMLKQTREKDLALFLKMSKMERPATPMDLSMRVVIPAFAIGELKKAFEIGFLIFMPFLVIDMVVASVLLSMGMMMLPPVMVSLPFKLLLFVLVDGWQLVIGSLIAGYR